MTQTDIIKLAREAGIRTDLVTTGIAPILYTAPWDGVHIEQIEKFATLVTQTEREACKAACDAVAVEYGGVAEGRFVTDFGKHTHQSMAAGALNCASAIRARNQPEQLAHGIALESGEFVPAEQITDWAAA